VPAGSGNVYLQLGAFKFRQGAQEYLVKMSSELGDSGRRLDLFAKDGLVRVHYGPFASKEEARAAAEKLQVRLGFTPIVSEH
jgi:rare lipoprotein A